MTENKICCDHCGKELDTQNDYDNIEIEMNHKWQRVDLCDDCFEQLWSMIDDFCSYGERAVNYESSKTEKR